MAPYLFLAVLLSLTRVSFLFSFDRPIVYAPIVIVIVSATPARSRTSVVWSAASQRPHRRPEEGPVRRPRAGPGLRGKRRPRSGRLLTSSRRSCSAASARLAVAAPAARNTGW